MSTNDTFKQINELGLSDWVVDELWQAKESGTRAFAKQAKYYDVPGIIKDRLFELMETVDTAIATPTTDTEDETPNPDQAPESANVTRPQRPLAQLVKTKEEALTDTTAVPELEIKDTDDKLLDGLEAAMEKDN